MNETTPVEHPHQGHNMSLEMSGFPEDTGFTDSFNSAETVDHRSFFADAANNFRHAAAEIPDETSEKDKRELDRQEEDILEFNAIVKRASVMTRLGTGSANMSEALRDVTAEMWSKAEKISGFYDKTGTALLDASSRLTRNVLDVPPLDASAGEQQAVQQEIVQQSKQDSEHLLEESNYRPDSKVKASLQQLSELIERLDQEPAVFADIQRLMRDLDDNSLLTENDKYVYQLSLFRRHLANAADEVYKEARRLGIA